VTPSRPLFRHLRSLAVTKRLLCFAHSVAPV
jgi:hypothetical protein